MIQNIMARARGRVSPLAARLFAVTLALAFLCPAPLVEAVDIPLDLELEKELITFLDAGQDEPAAKAAEETNLDPLSELVPIKVEIPDGDLILDRPDTGVSFDPPGTLVVALDSLSELVALDRPTTDELVSPIAAPMTAAAVAEAATLPSLEELVAISPALGLADASPASPLPAPNPAPDTDMEDLVDIDASALASLPPNGRDNDLIPDFQRPGATSDGGPPALANGLPLPPFNTAPPVQRASQVERAERLKALEPLDILLPSEEPIPLPPPAPEPAIPIAMAESGPLPVPLDSLGELVASESLADNTDEDIIPPERRRFSAAPDFTPTLSARAQTLLPVPVDPAALERMKKTAEEVEEHCLMGEVEKAREAYDRLPPFGGNGELNRLRSDAANLMVLNYGLDGRLEDARAVFDALPEHIPGDGAMLGKARAILNLTTFYMRARRELIGYGIFTNMRNVEPTPEIYDDLFKLAARMIPYLDNVGEYEKAEATYVYLRRLAALPGGDVVFATYLPSVTKYLLGRPSAVASNPSQERRQIFMEAVFDTLDDAGASGAMAELRLDTAEAMLRFYRITGDRRKADGMRALLRQAGRTTD